MKINLRARSFGKSNGALSGAGLVLLAAVLIPLSIPAHPKDGQDGNGKDGNGHYQQTNLVSDQPGMATLQDTNLVNAWGISFSATSPFWVSANGTGLAVLYAVTNDSSGGVHVTKQGLQVSIPGEGNPTGQLFNTTTNFHGDLFIFASEDGTISGWRGALGTTAETLVMPANTVYKGITLVTNGGKAMLLAANFRQGTLDAYDAHLNLTQFADPSAPAGYAPFNVRSIGGMVFVTFAKQDAAKHDDVAGPGNGLIDLFDPQTGVFTRFATGTDAGGKLRAINSPWGLEVSPASFGKHGDELLVGNFGSGTIMAFEADGTFRGLLKGFQEGPLMIDGLWGLTFGNGGRGGVPDTLYFSAGPNSESNGLFGSLQPATGKQHGEGEDEDNDQGQNGDNNQGQHKGNKGKAHGHD